MREVDAVTGRKVTVVSFDEPDSSKAKLSRKRPRIEAPSATAQRSKPAASVEEDDGVDFDEAFKEVINLGITGLDKRSKKQLREDAAAALGKQASKKREPLFIIQGKRKAQREKHARRVEEAHKAGVVLSRIEETRYKGEKKAKRQNKQRRESRGQGSLGLSRYVGGVLKVKSR